MAMVMDGKLAIDGGTPVRTAPWGQWPIYDERDERALLRALHSGAWSMGGTETAAFEEELAKAMNAEHACTTSSGSSALEAALFAAGVEYGDEVIVPPYTFVATATACILRGAIPVFVDIDPDTYCLDATKVEAAITPRTRAIMPVHIGGYPADMDALMEIAGRHGLYVIEDACQAIGATWRGKAAGTLGHMGCFSFQSSKNINCGEGGAVLTDDAALAERALAFKNYGRSTVSLRYGHPLIGTNFRMTQFQAALLRAQLERLEEWTERRAENGEYLCQGLRETGGLTPQPRDPRVTRHGFHLVITRYDSGAFGGWSNDKFCEALAAEGIGAFAGYGTIFDTGAIHDGSLALARFIDGSAPREYQRPACPVASKAVDGETVWLVNQPVLLGTRDDMDDILRAVEKIKRAANGGS